MIHSKMTIEARTVAMEKFVSGESKLLMCTHCCARGLDFPLVRIVVNFDMPDDPKMKTFDKKAYISRIGRTARFDNDHKLLARKKMMNGYSIYYDFVSILQGRSGLAVNLISNEDMPYLRNLGEVMEIQL